MLRTCPAQSRPLIARSWAMVCRSEGSYASTMRSRYIALSSSQRPSASNAASRRDSHSYATRSSGNITVYWFGRSRSTMSMKPMSSSQRSAAIRRAA